MIIVSILEECRVSIRCHHLINPLAFFNVYPWSQGGLRVELRMPSGVTYRKMLPAMIVKSPRCKSCHALVLKKSLAWTRANIPIRFWQFALLVENGVIIHNPLRYSGLHSGVAGTVADVLITPTAHLYFKWNSWRVVPWGQKSELFCFLNGLLSMKWD